MTFKLLINGELVAGVSEMEVINPANESVIALSPRADEGQLESAIIAAKKAQVKWGATPLKERAAALKNLAAAVEEHAAELANLLTQEVGRPLALCHFEVMLTQKSCDYYSQQKLDPELLFEDHTMKVESHRVPLGVVAAILPWNAPLYLAINKLAPAVLAGNSVILKPAPTTPLATLKLGELIRNILPAGVVNIITDQNDLGPLLVNHKDVAKVAFTGSTVTGKKIMEAAASNMQKITLELSGNDPAIVLPDVDPKVVAPDILFGSFFNSGQICAVIKRLYVHDDIYDELCTEMASLLEHAVVGEGSDEATQYGPIQNKTQFEKVKTFLVEADRSGKIIAGGKVLEGKGYFIRPTLVRDISDGNKVVDEEAFGPILPIIRYSDIEDAIAKANASNLGLGASVWSSNETRAREVAERLEAGTVWINQHCAIDPSIPFPTSKQSGVGTEAGLEGLLEYTNLKVYNCKKSA